MCITGQGQRNAHRFNAGNHISVQVFEYNPGVTGPEQFLTTTSVNNPDTVTTNAVIPVSISITASANNICSGQPVIFNAYPVNGGSFPVFQWMVNGKIAGNNSNIYQYVPLNGDTVSCSLTSNINCPCVTGNPAISNTIKMSVSALSATPEICMVTVDIVSDKNLVVWEPTANSHIESYNIYRLSGTAYQLAGNVKYGSPFNFQDKN